ncbi:DUF6542 domain-containing protein [Nocardioides daejeonensis]|uniref:DUF6542 domain-containing protein n=1 Tax=Nocardioides daejeonensis TaxID=1046556 RepID=UPI000D7463F0|nr:DUF6542 domain-containing protein [Nocardioides daejeonensis]
MARARTLWEEGDEPARSVALLGVAVTVTLLLLDLLVTRGVGLLFDCGFVLLCVGLALRVRPPDFLTIAGLPPTLMVGTFWAHAVIGPEESTIQALVRTLSEHVGALVIGYTLFLSCLLLRHEFVRRRRGPHHPAAR